PPPGVPHASSAGSNPRGGPCPATGSATGRSNLCDPGGAARPGAVTSTVGPGHAHRSIRTSRIGRPPTRSPALGEPMRLDSPPARTTRVTSLLGGSGIGKGWHKRRRLFYHVTADPSAPMTPSSVRIPEVLR